MSKTSCWHQNKSSALAWPGQATPGQNEIFILESTGGFAQAEWSPCTWVRKSNCRHSIIFYRGNKQQDWEEELQSIIQHAEKTKHHDNVGFQGKLKILVSPSFLKPFRCAGILSMLLNASGIFIISRYTDTFLEVLYKCWCCTCAHINILNN